MLYDESGYVLSRKIRNISSLTCIIYCLRAVIPALFFVLKVAVPALDKTNLYNYGLIVMVYGILEIAMILLVLHILSLSRESKHYTNNSESSVDEIIDVGQEPFMYC